MSQDLHANAPPPEVREADPARGCRRLNGRVALLTAAARGIGFASAVRLAAEGARCGSPTATKPRWPPRVAAQAAGQRLQTQVMDSADAEDVAAVIAAIGWPAPATSTSWSTTPAARCTRPTASWTRATHTGQQVMNLNVMGAVWASRAVLPAMAAQRFGRIVNFGSKAGRFGSLIAGPTTPPPRAPSRR
jgi:NAD(P)-dependent dehydrogenase (short-subunit alcohol dehydrogenase family)